MLKLRLGMSKIRVKHYAYLVVVAGLLVVSLVNIVANISQSVAEANFVTITSPAEGQEVQDSDTKIKGTAPPLKEVVVYDGSRRLGETTTLANGTWSLDWTKVKPGGHNLKAYLVDGDIYQGDVLSQNSVKGINMNNGQVNRNFAAGFSGASASFYDSQDNKTYTINTLSGTISVVDAIDNEPIDTFAYRSENATLKLLTEDMGTFCSDNTIWFTCAYIYDDDANLLYFLEGDSIYIVNVESKTTQSIIDNVEIVEDSELNYRLYLDPSKNYLYVYHRDNHYSNNKIQRIDLSENALSENFTIEGNSIVSTANGDVFYGGNNNGLNFFTSNNPDSAQPIDISGTGCSNEIENVALATDDSMLYASCEAGSTDKVAVVNMSDKQVAGSFDRNGPLLTYGNLKTDKLLMSGYENIEDTDLIDVYNTSSQASEQSIYPIEGGILPSSLIINSDKITFSTVDSNNAITRVYVVDVNNSNQIANEYEYPATDFWGMKSAVVTSQNKLMFLPFFSGDTLGVIDLSDGDIEATVTNGMGAGGEVEHSQSAGRVFSISAPLPLTFSSVLNVADAASGDYQGAVKLPGYMPVSMAMDETGSRLYVIAVGLLTGDSKVFAVDTQSLAVVDDYESVADVFSGFDDLLFAYRIEVKDDKLVFTNQNELFVLDLTNDEIQSKELAEDSAQGNSTAAILGSSTLSPDGTKLAVLARQEIPDNDVSGDLDQVIKVYNTSDLSVEKTIYLSTYESLFMYSAVSFDNQGKLYALKSSYYAGLVSPTIDSIDIATEEVEVGASIKLTGTVQGLASVCIGADIDFDASNKYAALNFHCFSLIETSTPEDTGFYRNVVATVDLEDRRMLTSKFSAVKEINILHFYNLINSAATSFNVVSAERQVNAVASYVSITSPSNNAKIKKGSRKIKGTGPPNRTLTIKVDGSSIGMAEADEYGLWQKTYNFSKTKSYKIKAEITNPDQHIAYATLISIESLGENVDFSGSSLGVIDPIEGEVFDEFHLPSPYLAFMPEVKGNSIYTLAVNPATDGANMRFYKLNKNTGAVQSYAALNNTSVNSMGLYMFSSDYTKLYMISRTDDSNDDPDPDNQGYSLQIFNLSDGSVIKTVNFQTPNIGSGENGPFGFGGKMMYVENINTVIFVYPDGKGYGVIDLGTDEVTLMPIPDEAGITFSSVTYDKAKDRLYSVMVNNTSDIPISQITSLSPEAALSNSGSEPEVDWATQIEGYYVNPLVAFSSERESLVFTGSALSSTPGEFEFVVIEMNVNDGTFTTSTHLRLYGLPSQNQTVYMLVECANSD